MKKNHNDRLPKLNIQKPHDSLFRITLSDQTKAKELIKAGLPPEIVDLLDLDSLQLKESSILDEALSSFEADLIYQCELKGSDRFGGKKTKVWLSLLLEHKSYIPGNPYLQLMGYIYGLWKRQEEAGQPIRPVIPIIFYHGQKEWIKRSFFDFFEGGGVHELIRPFVPNFQYWLISLQEKGDDWIKEKINDKTLKTTLLLMRYIFSLNILELLPFIFEEFCKQERSEKGDGELDKFYVYLSSSSKASKEKIKEEMEKIWYGEPIEGSVIWQWKQEGIEEGKAEGKAAGIIEGRIEGKIEGRIEGKIEGRIEGKVEGRLEGKIEGKMEGKMEVARNLLHQGLPVDMISKVTEIPLKILKDMKKALDSEK